MRVAGFTTGAALALVAAALAFLPLAVHTRRAAAPPLFHGTTTVWAVPVAGGPARQVLRLRGQYDFPAGLADGSLALVEPTRGGAELWRFRGAHATRLGPLRAYAAPVWSPDRSEYASWEPNARIEIRRLDGSPVRTLAVNRGVGGISCPSWAGPYLACVRQSRPGGGWRLALEVWRDDGTLVRSRRLAAPFGSVTVVARPDGHVLVVRPFGDARAAPSPVPTPQWTRDGRTLVYVDARGRLLARGARTRVLLQRAGDFGLSADGDTVYVARVKAAVSIPK